MTNAALSSDPIAELWREARAWLAAALRDFRGAAEIARTLAHEARAAIRRRLLMIESLVMKLLLIEAARLAPVPPASSRQRRAEAACGAGIQSKAAGWKPAVRREDAARPETWRVRFHLRNASGLQRKRARDPMRPGRLARLRVKSDADPAARDQAKAAKQFGGGEDKPSDKGSGEAAVFRKPRVVRPASLKASGYLKSKEDIEAFLAALRAELEDALNNDEPIDIR